MMMQIYRASIIHTPKNAFENSDALETWSDGGLLVSNGIIKKLGNYSSVLADHLDCATIDLRPGLLLPGFIDTHVHYPQVRVIGALGLPLLDWLDQNTLPEEVKFSDTTYANSVAKEFFSGLVSAGTTSAMVFGCHFEKGQNEFFEEAASSGLRIASGMVLSDRYLRPELHQTPSGAYEGSKKLISKYHNKGKLLYAITPRFSLSASESILEVCQTLQTEDPTLRFTSHINENHAEIASVRESFPWAKDYLETYERFDLVHRNSIFAHNLHPTDSELSRMAASRASVSHCPCSNAALGSGFFPMRRHLNAGVHFAIGCDVGGGTSFNLSKEVLQAAFNQNLQSDGHNLTTAQMLYLATQAGAISMGLEQITGDFSVGKAADMQLIRPQEGTVLKSVFNHADSPERMLSALFAISPSDALEQVWVDGDKVYERGKCL